jgi:large conductance mechanosensitive channel
VKDLLTPLVAAIFKQPDFSALVFTLNGSKFLYGDVINAFISFIIVAIAIYFFVVLPINKIYERIKKEPPAEATTRVCPECLSNIPAKAKRCAYCTAVSQ